jgi:glycosyltransferase involved in cell wall biosynthesis
VSLAAAGFDVTLISPAEQIESVAHGVKHVPVTRGRGRLRRMTVTVMDVLRKAWAEHADAYHIHSPELIPAGILLKLGGKRVVYDAHEDLPDQIASKPWIAPPFRQPVVAAAGILLSVGARVFDGIVAATPTIAEDFPAHKTSIVQNFPVAEEFSQDTPPAYATRAMQVIYVGGITEIRGIREMVHAMELVNECLDARFALVGDFVNEALKRNIMSMPGWKHVDFHGFLDRDAVVEQLNRSRVGLVLFHPVPNHVNSQPNKLFEYMISGIPILASDFPRWTQFVDEPGTGLTVDPLDPSAIAKAIIRILTHPQEAEEMGNTGRDLALTRYIWSQEAEKLVNFYRDQVLT